MGNQEVLSVDQNAPASLPITAIRTDGGTQTRRSLNASVVRHYCALLKEDTRLPPLRVWFDGQDFWLVDGFHRLAAAESAGFKYVTAQIFHGPLDAAIWDSFSANSRHGLPRKRREVITIIERALQHSRAASLSNVEIAKHLGVTETTVRRWRRTLSSTHDEDRFCAVMRRGTTYTMKTAKIGSQSRPEGGSKKSHRQLSMELDKLRNASSDKVGRLLYIVQNWVIGATSGAQLLLEIDNLLTAMPLCEPTKQSRKSTVASG